jgi:hypothetical protein
MDENLLSIHSELDFDSDTDAMAIASNCVSRMEGVLEGIQHIYENLCKLDEGLTNHLEFLISKKAAPSKVLTVSRQILTLQETIEQLNEVAGLLSYNGEL